MSGSFADILNRPATEVEAPKPLPVGTYLASVKGLPEFNKVGQQDRDVADFTLVLIQAEDDVDAEDLEAYGKTIQGREMRARFFLTEDALYRLKDFMEKCGIDVTDKKKTLAQLINDVPGSQVKVYVTHRPNQDGSQIYNEIKSYAGV